mgnify:CR=1 FL=1
MASILRVNTLTDASSNNSTPMATVNQGTAKAWINFNGGGTIAARDSFNVGSLTDSGTGKYDINYSSNMGNTSYIISTLSSNLDGNDDANQRISGERKSNTRSTSMTPVHSGDWFYVSSATFSDGTNFYTSTHGDSA